LPKKSSFFCLFGYFLALSVTFGQVYGPGHMMHNGVVISGLGFLRGFCHFGYFLALSATFCLLFIYCHIMHNGEEISGMSSIDICS
jgi:hypothetical protein